MQSVLQNRRKLSADWIRTSDLLTPSEAGPESRISSFPMIAIQFMRALTTLQSSLDFTTYSIFSVLKRTKRYVPFFYLPSHSDPSTLRLSPEFVATILSFGDPQ